MKLKTFFRACRDGNLKLVKKIINNASEDVAVTGLLDASANGHTDVVKFLFTKGVDVKARNNEAIIWACEYGHIEIVKFLLLNGADPTVQDYYAIKAACRFNYTEVVKFLIQTGINPEIYNNYLVQTASDNNNFKLIRFLVEKGADWKICSEKHKEILKTEQIQTKFLRNKMKNIIRFLIPVYYSPLYIGGKLAKKDLQSFITNLSEQLYKVVI